MLKYYVDGANRFIGGVDVPPNTPPVGATEVATPPPHSDFYTWNPGTNQWDKNADADDREATRDFGGEFEIDRIKRLLFEINFDQENRIRVLEGAPAITKAQYKAALINLLKTL